MENQGIEMQFVDSWYKWDIQDDGIYYFYKVQLKHDVFPWLERDGVEWDLLVDTQNCIVEVYAPNQQNTEQPVFTSKFKATLV